jgi:hypothetical protein
MLTKIKRKECLNKYHCLPVRFYNKIKEEDDIYYPNIFGSYVLTLPSKFSKVHSKLMGIELTGMAKEFNSNYLVFLGDNKKVVWPWMTFWNMYDITRSKKEAITYLVNNKVGKRFNGALQVEVSELTEFVQHLYWLNLATINCFNVYFTDPEQNFVGHICQYGNLHIDTLHGKADQQLKAFLNNSLLKFSVDTKCYSNSNELDTPVYNV